MLRVIDYSEKAVALVGDTFSIKDKIKQIGGTFNKSLHIENTTVPGWIFPINKKSDVEELVKSTPASTKSSTSKQSYNTNDHKSSISIDPKITHEMFANLLNKYEMLEARVQFLEDQLNVKKQSVSSSSKKSVSVLPKNSKQIKKSESSDEEEEEQEIKPKRFLSDI